MFLKARVPRWHGDSLLRISPVRCKYICCVTETFASLTEISACGHGLRYTVTLPDMEKFTSIRSSVELQKKCRTQVLPLCCKYAGRNNHLRHRKIHGQTPRVKSLGGSVNAHCIMPCRQIPPARTCLYMGKILFVCMSCVRVFGCVSVCVCVCCMSCVLTYIHILPQGSGTSSSVGWPRLTSQWIYRQFQ